jgi:hypothetical protein
MLVFLNSLWKEIIFMADIDIDDDEDVEEECLKLLKQKERREKKRDKWEAPTPVEISKKLEEIALAQADTVTFWKKLKEEEEREPAAISSHAPADVVKIAPQFERLFVSSPSFSPQDCHINAPLLEIIGPLPFFASIDQLVRPHVQQDLIASGFLFLSLRLKSSDKSFVIPDFLFDWLLSLISFSPNQHVPLPAFHTLSSLMASSQSLAYDGGVLAPSFSLASTSPEDEEEGLQTPKWRISWKRFTEILIKLGASPQKLTDLPDSHKEADHSVDGDIPPPNISLFNLDLLIQTLSVCVRFEGKTYSVKEIRLFMRTCCQLLLDPVGRLMKASIQEAIALLLDALPTMNGAVCQELCEDILSPIVSQSSQQRVLLAHDIPITSCRSRFFVAAFSYLALHRVISRPKARVSFLDRPMVTEVTKLLTVLQKQFLKKKISPFELCCALEFVDLLIHKDSLIKSADPTDFKAFSEAIKEFRQVGPHLISIFLDF